MSDLDDLQITYRGKLYRRIGFKPHVRTDGRGTARDLRKPLPVLGNPSPSRDAMAQAAPTEPKISSRGDRNISSSDEFERGSLWPKKQYGQNRSAHFSQR